MQQIDFAKVRTILYHLPDGKILDIPVEGIEQFIEFGTGRICDTSDVNGVVHFFPRGNA
mgnify:CR=1 FL=1